MCSCGKYELPKMTSNAASCETLKKSFVSIKYQLISFEDESDGSEKKMIDIVPAKWIFSNDEDGQLYTRFMPPPYTDDRCDHLHSLVSYCGPPDSDWPAYKIKLSGQARDYAEALNKLSVLKKEQSAYTSDKEMTRDQRARENIQHYKNTSNIPSEVTSDVPVTLHVPQIRETVDQESNNALSEGNSGVNNNGETSALPEIITRANNGAGCNASPRKSTNANVALADEGDSVFTDSLLKALPAEDLFDYKKIFEELFAELLVPINAQLREIKVVLSELKSEIQKNRSAQQTVNIASVEPEDLGLPLNTMERFLELETIISNDGDQKNQIMSLIWHRVTPSTPVVQSIRRVFKTFFKKELISEFTAVKNVGKPVMIKTRFFSCLQGIINEKNAKEKVDVTTKDMEQAVGRVINAAKDWDGARQARRKNN